eukprot:1795087-Rhodomonas_salina.2
MRGGGRSAGAGRRGTGTRQWRRRSSAPTPRTRRTRAQGLRPHQVDPARGGHAGRPAPAPPGARAAAPSGAGLVRVEGVREE